MPPRPRAARGARLADRASASPSTPSRRAEELSKGNQQKVQFIAAVLHDPEVLLMDEPFTGLDPVNLVLLREAFIELRDRGRTLIFSTHQMEAAEAMCESVAIVDHGRLVAGGTRPRPQAGERPADAAHRARRRRVADLAADAARRRSAVRPGRRAAPSSSCCPAPIRRRSSPRSSAAAARSRRFEVAEPSLEAIFIEHVGRPVRRRRDARARTAPVAVRSPTEVIA